MAFYLTEDGFRLDTAVIRTQSGIMRTGNDNITDVLGRTQTTMRDMLRNELWNSSAAQLIVDKFEALRPRIEEQRQDLEKFCKFLDDSAQKYEQAETERHTDAAGV